jgi:hypothetical protein
MPGWSTLVIDLRADPDQRERLRELLAAHGVINETALQENGEDVGSVTALPRATLKAAKDATNGLEGQARALRVDADIISTDGSRTEASTFVFLAVDMFGRWIDHDDPTINGAIRFYLGAYLPVLGPRFVAVSTLLDRIMYAGGLTALEAPSVEEARLLSADDPWGRIYPGHVYRTASTFFQRQLPPPGPGTQRSGGGSPWPFHWAVKDD